MKKRYSRLLLAALLTTACGPKAPTATAQSVNLKSYYSRADGKKKAELKTALYQIIGNPNVKSYGSLWTYYYQTDRRSDNQVVDRYSNERRYFSGNSGNAVSGMNKEHGIPKSWWGGSTAGVGSDLHHVMPSDTEANSRKSNFGMGVVTSQTWSNGSIKVGRGQAGNNGTVQLWEPADQWKGDFARIYFYIVTCYEQLSMVQQQGANTMQTTTYPKLQPWASQLYLQWARQDPVSDIERQRNEIVYKIQGNRNPFIDYPSLAEYIWGDSINYAFSIDGSHNIDPVDPDTTHVDTTHVGPVNPDAHSGSIVFKEQTWTATTHPTYGSGFTTKVNGLTLAYYQHKSSVTPICVDTELRFYDQSLFTIEGAEVTSVTFHDAGGSKSGCSISIGSTEYSFEDGKFTWTGTMSPFVCTANKQSRLSGIDVTVKGADGMLTNFMSPIRGSEAVFDAEGRYLGTSLPAQRGLYIIRQNGKTRKHFKL